MPEHAGDARPPMSDPSRPTSLVRIADADRALIERPLLLPCFEPRPVGPESILLASEAYNRFCMERSTERFFPCSMERDPDMRLRKAWRTAIRRSPSSPRLHCLQEGESSSLESFPFPTRRPRIGQYSERARAGWKNAWHVRRSW